MLRVSGLACGLVLAASGWAFGQQGVQVNVAAGPGGAQIRRMSHIIGSNVQLQGANNFGKVEDVVLNDNGGVEYVVVARNGQYAMLPWSAGNMNWGNRVISYNNVTPQAVQPLFFGGNAWPTAINEEFVTRTRKVFPNYTVHQVARPVTVGPNGAPVPPPAGAAPGPVVDEKVKVKRNGSVKVKERVRD